MHVCQCICTKFLLRHNIYAVHKSENVSICEESHCVYACVYVRQRVSNYSNIWYYVVCVSVNAYVLLSCIYTTCLCIDILTDIYAYIHYKHPNRQTHKVMHARQTHKGKLQLFLLI